jgi:PAS domain S-box-containing protein
MSRTRTTAKRLSTLFASLRRARFHRGPRRKRYIRKDGITVWARLVTSVVRDEHNQPQYAISVVEDATERKQAEAELSKSEERFRATFFQAAVGIAQTGLDSQWLLLNGRLCQILGYSRAELLGKTFLDVTHPDDRDANVVAREQFLAGEISSWSTEKRYVHMNGATVWAKVHVSLVRDQHKQPQYFISVVEDVTELKLFEERLRASETRLREAQRLAKLGSWERLIDTDTIRWSDEVLRIFGLPADALSNFLAFLSHVHPKDRARVLKADSNVRSSSVPVEVEYRIMRPDGATRFVRSIVEAIRNDQGVPIHVVGTTQDITEQVKAGELLRESEERLKSAERLAHVGHWHWDTNSDQLFWSEEMFHIFGQPRDYTPSYEGFFHAVIPQNRERLRRELRDAVADHSEFSSEVQIARPNGDLRTITFVAEVLLDEESLLIGMFGAIQDITPILDARKGRTSPGRSWRASERLLAVLPMISIIFWAAC